jgi:hypothetical protein
MATDKDVARKLEALWPDSPARRQALVELERYGHEAHEREPERVRLAILKLCEGELKRVVELVVAAKRDYRDVLMSAEYPAEGQALWALHVELTSEERRRLEELWQQDREQYEEWLKG